MFTLNKYLNMFTFSSMLVGQSRLLNSYILLKFNLHEQFLLNQFDWLIKNLLNINV